MSIKSARLLYPGLPFHRKIEEDWETRDQKGDMLLPMHSLRVSSEMPVSINPTIHLHPGRCIPTAATESGAQFSQHLHNQLHWYHLLWLALSQSLGDSPMGPLLAPQRWQHSWAAAPLLRGVACYILSCQGPREIWLNDKLSDCLCRKCKECKLLRGVLIEQMGVTGHGFRVGESISQMLLHVHSRTLFSELVNITDFTNFNCFVFPKSLNIFEGQYESL